MENRKKDALEDAVRSQDHYDEKARKIKNIAVTLRHTGKEEIASDVQGSYTGTPEDGSRPVQDSDDL